MSNTSQPLLRIPRGQAVAGILPLAGLVCAIVLLPGCAPDTPAPPSPPSVVSLPSVGSLPSAPQLPGIPAELQRLVDLKDTAEQLAEILQEPCLGKQTSTNSVYHIEMSSPQVRTVQAYGSSSGSDVPFQENFQRIADIINSGNGQFSQQEAKQICDELNAVIDEVEAMVSEATSGPGGLGPGGPGPGGPGPGPGR